jgi:hypothetical protein
MDAWLSSSASSLDARQARAALVHRWLATFGPATSVDVKWWTGWTVAQTTRALADVGAVEVGVEGGTGWVLPDDVGAPREVTPWVALLPTLDPTTMGWQQRDWYLGGHGAAVFDRNGNAGPTVWVDGRVVGGWAQRRGGEVVYELLEDVGRVAAAAISAAASALESRLGDVRVTPRFATPLQKKLARL